MAPYYILCIAHAVDVDGNVIRIRVGDALKPDTNIILPVDPTDELIVPSDLNSEDLLGTLVGVPVKEWNEDTGMVTLQIQGEPQVDMGFDPSMHLCNYRIARHYVVGNGVFKSFRIFMSDVLSAMSSEDRKAFLSDPEMQNNLKIAITERLNKVRFKDLPYLIKQFFPNDCDEDEE